MKSLLFVLIGMVMFFFGNASMTIEPTTEGFANTYLYEEVDVGWSPVVTAATVSVTVSNESLFFGAAITDYPEACSKARLCADQGYNYIPVLRKADRYPATQAMDRLCKAEETIRCNIAAWDTDYYWHGSDSKASLCKAQEVKYSNTVKHSSLVFGKGTRRLTCGSAS